MNEPINGYTNYPTWACVLWLENEESTYKHWKNRATAILEHAQYSTFEAKYMLADEIKTALEEYEPLPSGLRHDLLQWAINEINFEEVAENFLND